MATTATTSTPSSLQPALDAINQHLHEIAPTALQVIDDGIAQTTAAQLAERSLRVGEYAPDFTLPNAIGGDVTLSHLLQQGPVVLTFYRGEWCPFCNLTLRAYQQALPAFMRYGATLIAVSPQTPDNSLTTVEQKELSYPVLSDVGNVVARRYRLVYALNDELRATLGAMGTDLAQFNGTDDWELPMPGTFVIGQDGMVRLAYVNADFRQRLEPTAIIDALAALPSS